MSQINAWPRAGAPSTRRERMTAHLSTYTRRGRHAYTSSCAIDRLSHVGVEGLDDENAQNPTCYLIHHIAITRHPRARYTMPDIGDFPLHLRLNVPSPHCDELPISWERPARRVAHKIRSQIAPLSVNGYRSDIRRSSKCTLRYS